MGSHKSHDDEVYEEGVHDGQQADFFDQATHSLTKGFTTNPRENEIYNSGYNYGVGHKSESNDDSSGSSGGGGCFISTACVAARGLPDDCHELAVLRQFRDNFVARLPEGRDLINQYYADAPRILASLNARRDSAKILEEIYSDLVAPSVALVEAAKPVDALNLYVRKFSALQRGIYGQEA